MRASVEESEQAGDGPRRGERPRPGEGRLGGDGVRAPESPRRLPSEASAVRSEPLNWTPLSVSDRTAWGRVREWERGAARLVGRSVATGVWHPASPQTLQHTLGPLPKGFLITALSPPGRLPFTGKTPQSLSQMGREQAVRPLRAKFELSYLLIEGVLNSREGFSALNSLQFSSRPPRDEVVPDHLPGPCPGPPPQCWPGSNLCHVPQGLLQPLSLLCLQGCLLLGPQGFLEWCWGDKERVVRVSALVRNSTVSLPGPPSIRAPRRPCPEANGLGDPTAAPVPSLNRPGPDRYSLPQAT